MKKTLSFFSLLILIGCGQKNNCADFKTGKFEYADPKFSEWKVMRNDSMQYEINTENGVEILGTLEWHSDCNYTLTYKEVSNPDYAEIVGKKMQVEILETTENKYKFHSKIDTVEVTAEMLKTE